MARQRQYLNLISISFTLMSNRTSPSTSADLAQGHVSKKPAGAEAPVSTPGLAKGSFFCYTICPYFFLLNHF